MPSSTNSENNVAATAQPPEQRPVKVLLADDHALVRAGIRALLEQIPGVTVAGEAGDGRTVLEMARVLVPDIVIMDIAMPNMNGLEATSRLKAEHHGIRIIVLSMHQNEEYYWQSLKAGASGYILKKAAPLELRTAVEKVRQGDTYLSREVAERLAKRLPPGGTSRGKSPLEKLTPRQREILQLIAEGQHTKAIASTLSLSTKTVEYHRLELMDRLGIHDIPGLVRFAYQVGLVTHET